jgi:hypothetical protein
LSVAVPALNLVNRADCRNQTTTIYSRAESTVTTNERWIGEEKAMAKLSRIAPDLPVPDLGESIDCYEHQLGFHVAVVMPDGETLRSTGAVWWAPWGSNPGHRD